MPFWKKLHATKHLTSMKMYEITKKQGRKTCHDWEDLTIKNVIEFVH